MLPHSLLVLFTAYSTAISTAEAQATNYRQNAELAFKALQTWYNRTSGLWDTTGWWNSANALTTIADLTALDASVRPNSTSVFSNTFTQAQIYNLGMTKVVVSPGWLMDSFYVDQPQWYPAEHFVVAGTTNLKFTQTNGFLNDYYDDEGWWALAWIAAYDITQNGQYLATSASIFEDMKGGWNDSRCGGGIWWDKDHTYVNAIANELFFSVAAHLANRIPQRKSYYVGWAQKEWQWFQASGMINQGSLINDGLAFTNNQNTTCANNGGTVWSYNQGVVLGALVELNKAAPQSSYLSQANAISAAAIRNLTTNGVLHDVCEPNCGADGSQFKGVFMRNLQILQAVSPNALYANTVLKSAQSIWTADRNPYNNRLSVQWAGPFIAPANASTQSSALDALVAAVALSK